MTQEEARRMLATYLAGGRAESGQLADARQASRDDLAWTSSLQRDLGLVRSEPSDCALFSANLADFCAMSAGERRDEAPEAWAHAVGCAHCKALYWSVQAPWSVARRERVQAVLKTLAEPICLALGVAAGLFEEGLGPPALRPPHVAALAGSERMTARLEWRLPDDEAGVSIHLVLEASRSGGARLSVGLEGTRAVATSRAAQIEVWRADEDRPHAAGALGEVQVEPLLLAPSSWRVRVAAERGARAWEIQLELTRARGGRP